MKCTREIRRALLAADVNVRVVRSFIDAGEGRPLGAGGARGVCSPGQQFVKIVNDELSKRSAATPAKLTMSPKPPTIVMLAGLQGSGKTTRRRSSRDS